jgi:hypothetical protein
MAHIDLYEFGMHPLGACSQVQNNTHDGVCGGEALNQSCYLWDVSMFVRNEVNPSFIGGARITHSLGSTTPLGLGFGGPSHF